jgi:hypothetical protein
VLQNVYGLLKAMTDIKNTVKHSVAEPHQFYAAPALALGENFDAAPATTLLYCKAKLLNRTKV